MTDAAPAGFPAAPAAHDGSAPLIHFLALGGTIASVPADSGNAGVTPQVGAEAIAAAARLDTLPGTGLAGGPGPELLGPEGAPAGGVRVTFAQLAQVGSGASPRDRLTRVVRATRRAAAAGARAVVLTQGTDTLEESAFALSVMNDAGIPIVLTGAMRGPSLPGADGPANVRAAVVTALDEQMSFLPAVLVFNDEVHDPTFVRKAHASSASTFTSGPAAGPLGWVSEDRLVLAHMPARVPSPFGVPEQEPGLEGTAGAGGNGAAALGEPGTELPEITGRGTYPDVALIEVGMGESLKLLSYLPDAGYAGAVIAGVGGGHVPFWALDEVEALAKRVPVVYASRTGSGRTLESTYGYPGSELDLQRLGLIPAGFVDARKARLLLTLALAAGAESEQIAQVFAFFRG